ncbi:MAG TPA: deoxyribodipyrimidine photo-lyase, partial [Acidobacteriota bacterium]|nr:deoxyribodipyrimidine photo-lyase [Acidobacteriota bacterium]
MIDIGKRSRQLADGRCGAGPVVYWMSRDQRVQDNWALLLAQNEALARKKPLVVVFCLTADYPGAELRSYHFLLNGLEELQQRLAGINIPFAVLIGDPPDSLPTWLISIDAHLLVGDFDPLRIKRQWQQRLLSAVTIPFIEVDTHNVIP